MSRDDNFLSRWSRRKHASARGETPEPAPETRPAAPAAATSGIAEVPKAQAPLPPVEGEPFHH